MSNVIQLPRNAEQTNACHIVVLRAPDRRYLLTPNSPSPRTSRSCAALRIQKNSFSRPYRSASPASASPIATASPVSCAPITNSRNGTNVCTKRRRKVINLPTIKLVVGARLVFADGTPDILAYPQNRIAWGRLTRLLAVGKSRGEKAECVLHLDDLIEHIAGLNLIVMPPTRIDSRSA